jgi:hypothetical protein
VKRSGASREPWSGARVVAVILAFAAGAPPAAPRAARAEQGQSIDLSLGSSALYDDNFLQYSSDQLRVFASGLKPDRFSIRTSDDLLIGPYVSLTWMNEMRKARSRSLRLKWSGEFHKKNGTADLRTYSATWRETFSRSRRLTLYGYWLPSFYLRQLSDEDAVVAYPGLSKYRRVEFDLGIGALSWRQRITGKTRGEIKYQYEHRSYSPDFVERTSGTHQGELGVEFYRFPSRGSLEVHGGYRVSKAKAADSDTVGDDPDVSYHGIIAGLGWRMDLARKRAWKLGASAGYEFGTRAYDSSLPTDKYHYKRDDTLNTIDVALRWALPPHWAVRGVYSFGHNSAHLGTQAPPSSDAGSYTENAVGLAVDWSGSLWRQAKAAAGTEED